MFWVFLWKRVVFGFPHVTHNRTDTYYLSVAKTLDYYSFLPSNMTHHMQVNVVNRATIAHLAILGPVACTDANPVKVKGPQTRCRMTRQILSHALIVVTP